MLRIIDTILVLLTAAMVFTCINLSKEKRRRMELELYLNGLEKALGEFRRIRHQYNNMFQSIICYIENEEWDSIKNFKNEILQKTSASNKNNMLQLLKIKNYKIKSSILRIAEICNKNGINLNIIVSGEINSVNMNESALCKVIGNFFDYIINEVMRSSKKEIIIEACSDSQGVCLVLKNTFHTRTENEEICSGRFSYCNMRRNSETAATKKILERNKNVVFNNYIDHDYFRQEIMIFQKH